jgi:hypothetical protein
MDFRPRVPNQYVDIANDCEEELEVFYLTILVFVTFNCTVKTVLDNELNVD